MFLSEGAHYVTEEQAAGKPVCIDNPENGTPVQLPTSNKPRHLCCSRPRYPYS